MSDTALVVAPHHDDEAIGCGGVVALLAARGWQLATAWVFAPIEGVASKQGKDRIFEAKIASDILGISRTESLNHPCREAVDEQAITWQLVALIRAIRPRLLLIPHEDERDPEHRIVHRAATEAVWLAESHYREALGGPVPRISCILGYEVWTPIRRPNTICDITTTIDVKLSAVSAYASQQALADYAAGFEGLARYRSVISGAGQFAESFTVYRADAIPHPFSPFR